MRDDDILEIEDNSKSKKKPSKRSRKGLIGRLWNNILVRNLLYFIAGSILLILIINFILLKGTLHGKSFPMPDFSGMTVEEATAIAHEKHLRLEVTDSVFVPQHPRGTIFRQTPEPNVQVKKNRRVLLTVNSMRPRKIMVPDVVGYSLRQAKAVLMSQGLGVGKLSYESDIAVNIVLSQSYKGRSIDGNIQIDVGSNIDLTLGNGETGAQTIIPSVIGLSAEAAKSVLIDNSLNVTMRYDKAIRDYPDSLAARVSRQTPSPTSSAIWPLGTNVELVLKMEEPRKAE